MVQMKNSGEIGVFIKSRMNLLGLKAIQVAEELANAKGKDNYNKNQLRDLVYKWINGERTPGIDYVYYLSKILKVSIEELLVAGEVCEKYENRPYTLYAVAKSGNIEQLEKIMNTYTPDGTCVGENYDEYDKSILDYVVEFENVDMIKYMIDKGYIQFFPWGNHLNTRIAVGNILGYDEVVKKILMLSIKNDDLYLFSKIISREENVWRINSSETNDCYKRTNFEDGYELDEDVLGLILDTKNIFEYLTTAYIPSQETWNEMNRGVYYRDRESKGVYLNDRLVKIKRLPFIFNLLFDEAVKRNKTSIVKKLELIGNKHNEEVKKQLAQYYTLNDISVDEYGVCRNGRSGNLTIFAKIDKK